MASPVPAVAETPEPQTAAQAADIALLRRFEPLVRFNRGERFNT